MGKKHSKASVPATPDPSTGFYDGTGQWCTFDEDHRGFFDPQGRYFRFDETEPEKYYWDDDDVCYAFHHDGSKLSEPPRYYSEVTEDPDFWTEWDVGAEDSKYETILDDKYETIGEPIKLDIKKKLPPRPSFRPPNPPVEEKESDDDVPPPLPLKDYPGAKVPSSTASQSKPTPPPIPPRPTPSIPQRPPMFPASKTPSSPEYDTFPDEKMAADFEAWFRNRLTEELHRRKGIGGVATVPTKSVPPPIPPRPKKSQMKKKRPKRRPPPALIAALEAQIRKEEQQKVNGSSPPPKSIHMANNYLKQTPIATKAIQQQSPEYEIPNSQRFKVPSGRKPPPRPILPRPMTEKKEVSWWKKLSSKKTKEKKDRDQKKEDEDEDDQ